MRQDKSGFKVTFEVLYGSGTEGNILLHCGLKDTMERHYSSLTVQDPIVARIPNIFRSPRIAGVHLLLAAGGLNSLQLLLVKVFDLSNLVLLSLDLPLELILLDLCSSSLSCSAPHMALQLIHLVLCVQRYDYCELSATFTSFFNN